MAIFSKSCIDKFGCSNDVPPDFIVKRYSTKPSLVLIAEDCGDPIDLTLVVVEVSMWANAKLKKSISVSDSLIEFADNIGFNQVTTGDIILIDHPRSPEQMLVVGFDEENYIIEVSRGYAGSTVRDYKKGTSLKLFRFLNSNASTVMSYIDVMNIDGSVTKDMLSESKIVYDWSTSDTCLAGCYQLEFKLLKMVEGYQTLSTSNLYDNNIAGSVNSYISYVMPLTQCEDIVGTEWVRRFPLNSDGYMIKIVNTPNAEIL